MVDLIQVTCNARRPARLTVRQGDLEASLFFEDGKLVHAELGAFEGQSALDEILRWPDGVFELVNDVPTPTRTLSGTSTELLLSAMENIDKGNAEARRPASGSFETGSFETAELEDGFFRELDTAGVDVYAERAHDNVVQRLRRVPGVEGAVLVARDGTVLASDLEGNAEQEGKVTVLLGNAARDIGETLNLGSFEQGVVAIGQGRTLVIEQPSYFAGLLLAERTSPELTLTAATQLLDKQLLG